MKVMVNDCNFCRTWAIPITFEQDSQWLMIVSQDRKGRFKEPRTNHPTMLGKMGKYKVYIYMMVYIYDGIYI